jgi:transposase
MAAPIRRRLPMWTVENRGRYDRSMLRYPSDLTNEEWSFAKASIPCAKRGGNKRTVDVREVLNGLMYILSTGCQWRAIPKDLPPRSTVNYYFCRWQHDGTLDRLHHALYVLCREQADRQSSPTAAIIDSQSVKSAEKGGIGSIRRALIAARKSKGRSATSSSTRRAC